MILTKWYHLYDVLKYPQIPPYLVYAFLWSEHINMEREHRQTYFHVKVPAVKEEARVEEGGQGGLPL